MSSHDPRGSAQRPMVLRDAEGSKIHRADLVGIGDSKGGITQAELEVRNWHLREGEDYAPGVSRHHASVALISDYQSGFGQGEPLEGHPFGNDYHQGHSSTRVVDQREDSARVAIVAQGWRVIDALGGDYTTAIPMGPTIGGSADCFVGDVDPSAEGTTNPLSTTTGTSGGPISSYISGDVAGGATSAGYMWDGERNGLFSTVFVINCADMYGSGIDGTETGILSIRCDAHFDYGTYHGPINFTPGLDVTSWPLPVGRPFKMSMARDESAPNAGSTLGMAANKWVPWMRLPNWFWEGEGEKEEETPDPEKKLVPPWIPSFPPRLDGLGRPVRGGGAIDGAKPRLGGDVQFWRPSCEAVSPMPDRVSNSYLDYTEGYAYAPAAWSSQWYDQTNGRMVSYVSQYSGSAGSWGFTAPSGFQVGPISADDPYMQFGSDGEAGHVRQSVDGTAETFTVEALDATETRDCDWTIVLAARVKIGCADTSPVSSTYELATTDATVTTIATLAVSTGEVVDYRVRVVCGKTSGTAASDGAAYELSAAFRNQAGTLSQVGSTTNRHTVETDAAYDVTFATSGSDVLLQVTGSAGDDISWSATVETITVATA